MGSKSTPANALLWAAIGLLLLVCLFGATPVNAASSAVPNVDHHVTADGHHDQLAFTDHAHIGAATAAGAPDTFGDVVVPRSRAALIVVGLMFAAVLVWGLAPRHTVLVGRDPPRGPNVVSSGRDVLARLCISRR
ncbi:MAG: hypothetical protein KDB56_00065 [Mycobacterium sp.]|nr:hypothetical protein [Mycobacterium sp.]